MGTTPTYSWPYPEPTDPVANGAQDIEDLALAVETTVAANIAPYVPVTSYSPTYINFTLGNGSDEFYYAISGDIMMIEGKITIGSTTVFSTSSSVYIPSGYRITTYDLGSIITNAAQITYRETGVQDIIGHGKTSNGERILFLNDLANTTYVKEAIANGSTPFTFASGDEIRIRAQFLVAEAP